MSDLRAHLEKLAKLEPEAFQIAGPIDDLGLYATRYLPEPFGFWITVEPQTYGRARLGVTILKHPELANAIRYGYGDTWDYDSRAAAIAAMEAWNGEGEPIGWIRHAGTGRRRQPDGTLQIRTSDIDPRQLAELRQQVGEGAGHECEEWRGEHGRCVLCDKAFTVAPGPDSVFMPGPRPLIDPPADGKPTNRIVLTDFVNRGRAVQQQVDDILEDHKEANNG